MPLIQKLPYFEWAIPREQQHYNLSSTVIHTEENGALTQQGVFYINIYTLFIKLALCTTEDKWYI